MRLRPDLALIREKATTLRDAIQNKFPDLDVESADWVELVERVRQGISIPGEFELDFGADAYVWIRGEPGLLEKAATFAENLASDAWDQDGVTIIVRSRNQIWCKKSANLQAQSLGPGQEIERGPTLDLRQDSSGIEFWCLMLEEHNHDFGKFQKEYLAASR